MNPKDQDGGGVPGEVAPPLPTDLPADPEWSYNPEWNRWTEGELSVFDVPTLVDGPGMARLPDFSEEDEPPRPVDPDLTLADRLGRGGFGDVWLGRQVDLERSVAVKCLRSDLLAKVNPSQRYEMEKMFHGEALTVARLEHPNIVPIYQLSRDADGRLLLAMRRIVGEPWHEQIHNDFSLAMEEYLARHLPILIDVAQAVAYAHARGVIHRDLKPSQVIIGEFGEVMLMDWGLAVGFQVGVESPSVDPTSTQSPAGTPGFMAPEQTRDSPDQLGPWTDLYLLGGTLYYLLTGQVPHPGGSGAAAFQSAMEGQVVPPTERRPERGVPEELSALTMGLLAPAPEDRQPATVAGFIEALQAYQSGVGRKRRSTAITEAVAARPTGVRDYGELNRQGNALTEAEALWPGNPAVDAERRRLLVEYTEVALSRKDLTLARFQAEQLPPGEPRRGLLARVQGAGDRQRARERQRRLALSGLAVLGLIVLLGSFQYLLAQRRANERLLAERDAAREARAESEGLMAFMLDDVWQGLLEIERVDLLEPVARRASEFYADRDPGDLGPEEQRNRGKMFRTVGDLLSYQGVNDEAAGAYGQADQIFRRLHAEQGDLDLLAQSLETRVQRGLALSDLGDKEGALAVLEGVQTEARAAREANPEDPVLKSLLADAIDVWGVVVYDQGDLPRAQEAFAQAVTLYGELLGQNPGPSATDAYQAASMRLAVVLNETGQSTAALAELDRTHGYFTDGTLLEALQRNSNLAFAASTRAEILNRLDRPQESVALLAVMAPDTAASLAQDPTNIEVRYRHLTVLSSLAESHQTAGSPAAARQRWEEVVRLVAAVEGESSLLYLDDLKVRALLHLGRVEEARPVAKALLARHWTHRGFQELVAEHGISP